MPHGTADKGKLPTDVNTMVRKTLGKLLAQEKQLKREMKEINYYMKVHGMQDEGYTAVLAYAHKLKMRLAEVQKVSKRLAVLCKEKQLRVLRHTRYALLFDGKSIAAKCLREDQQWGLCLLQTTDERKPWRANALSAASVQTDSGLRMHAALGQAGSPVFSAWGRFVGMYNGVGIVPRNIIAKMLWNEK